MADLRVCALAAARTVIVIVAKVEGKPEGEWG